MNGDFGGIEMDDISDAVSRFIQSPSYLQPLLEFIDQHCSTFEDNEENKIEHRVIHENFKQLVDRLISDYLASLDVPVYEFVGNLARHSIEEAYDTLVKSILVVDDFALFKDMMLKRNNELDEEDSLNQPMDLELLEGLNITQQASDLDEVIQLSYPTSEQKKVQRKDGADLHRAPFMFTLSKEEKDMSKTEKKPIETEYVKAAACTKSPAAESVLATGDCGPVAESSSVTGKPHNVSLLVPTKENMKEVVEQSEHNQQGTPLARRRDHIVQPRDQMFSQKKVEREKQFRMTDDSEYRSSPYLQQYLKRESLGKLSIIQDDEAVRREKRSRKS